MAGSARPSMTSFLSPLHLVAGLAGVGERYRFVGPGVQNDCGQKPPIRLVGLMLPEIEMPSNPLLSLAFRQIMRQPLLLRRERPWSRGNRVVPRSRLATTCWVAVAINRNEG